MDVIVVSADVAELLSSGGAEAYRLNAEVVKITKLDTARLLDNRRLVVD